VRRHDRYVLSNYIATFFAVLFFFTLIVVVIDLADASGKFVRQWGSVKEAGYKPWLLLVEYYGTMTPFIWMRILPFVVSIAAAFCLARLSRHNELISLVLTGVSLRRVVLPILGAGVVVAGAMAAAQATVVAPLSQRHAFLRRVMEKRSPNRVTRVPHFHDPSGARLTMDAFLPLDRRMESVWVSLWGDDGLETMLWYPELAWDAERGVWQAAQGGERIPADGRTTGARRFAIEPGTSAPLQASLALLEVSLTVTDSLGQSYSEARELVDAHPTNARLVMAWHQLFVAPVSAVVLLLLVLPFALRVGRRSASSLPGMSAALGLGALFFGATQFCTGLAAGGDFNPVVMTWLPTVLFASLGMALFASLDA
jgi:lipopolysaccharide export LptBFGC system permease protein LptF